LNEGAPAKDAGPAAVPTATEGRHANDDARESCAVTADRFDGECAYAREYD